MNTNYILLGVFVLLIIIGVIHSKRIKIKSNYKYDGKVVIDDATFRKAMDNFAEDTAISFLEWQAKSDYVFDGGHWRFWDDDKFITTKKLYQIYKRDNP